MFEQGFIQEVHDDYVTVLVPLEKAYIIDKQNITTCEVHFKDDRKISSEQRKKIWAIIGDISRWSGHFPEEVKEILKWDFMYLLEIEHFSLSNIDMSTAREFISFLIEFCMSHNVPTKRPLMEYTDDMGRYLYACLYHRKCAICNDPAHIHHVNRVGMGNNRRKINHVGLLAIALCPKHHGMAHVDETALFEKEHVFAIKLDQYLVDKIHLNGKAGDDLPLHAPGEVV